MKPTDKAWQRLVQAARQISEERAGPAPYGFATQVAARAFARKRPTMSLIERFSLRALGVSGLLAVLGVVGNYSVIAQATAPQTTDSFFTVDDPAAIVLGGTDYE